MTDNWGRSPDNWPKRGAAQGAPRTRVTHWPHSRHNHGRLPSPLRHRPEENHVVASPDQPDRAIKRPPSSSTICSAPKSLPRWSTPKSSGIFSITSRLRSSSRSFRGDQRICYANKAFETLTGNGFANCWAAAGRFWRALKATPTSRHLDMRAAEGRPGIPWNLQAASEPKIIAVEAYPGLIENEDGSENYRIAALIDVTAGPQGAGKFIRQIRDKEPCSRKCSTASKTICNWSSR